MRKPASSPSSPARRHPARDQEEGARVSLGRIVKVRGVQGEVKVVPFAEASLPRYQALRRVFIQLPAAAGGEVVVREVAEARRIKGAILIRFAGCETLEAARPLVGGVIQIPESEVPPLPEGQFYHYELLGLKVYTVEGAYLGEVTEIFPTGSNDVYVVRDGPRETLIPAIRDVIRVIDLRGKRMVIHPLPGLLGDVAG